MRGQLHLQRGRRRVDGPGDVRLNASQHRAQLGHDLRGNASIGAAGGGTAGTMTILTDMVLAASILTSTLSCTMETRRAVGHVITACATTATVRPATLRSAALRLG
eukprot:5460082-Pyramimonas_sp.AAC.1